MRSLATIACVAAALSVNAIEAALSLTVNTTATVAEGVVAGFGWEMWLMLDALEQVNSPAFIKLASALAPSIVRVGGISADWIRYTLDDGPGGPPTCVFPTPCLWPPSPRNMSMGQFRTLLDIFNTSGLQLLFDLNELYGRDCHGGSNGETCSGLWDTSNVRLFLQYLHDNGLVGGTSPLIGFELGNELASHLDPVSNTQDVLDLVGIVNGIWANGSGPLHPVHGSGLASSAILPVIAPSTDTCGGATPSIMTNITRAATGFSYHAYPGGNGADLPSKCMNSSWLRTGILTGSDSVQCLRSWNDGPRADGLQLWLTETSESWNWNLTGPAQNAFVHSFYYLASLGQYSETGVRFHGRWSFSDPDSPFAAIAWNASADGGQGQWDAATDFFVTVLYHRTVGSGALSVVGDEQSSALVYSSCTAGANNNGSLTVYAVNPGSDDVVVTLRDTAGHALATLPRLEYVLTAPGDDVGSFTPVLNGNTGSPLRAAPDGSIPPMQPLYVDGSGSAEITIPVKAQAFFVLPNAAVHACGGHGPA